MNQPTNSSNHVHTGETTQPSPGSGHPFSFLWERWGKSQDWRDKLERQALHKALDIPEDDGTNVNNIRTGMTWRELLAIAALMTTAFVATAWLTGAFGDKPSPPAAENRIDDTDTDTGLIGIGTRPLE